MHRCLIWTVWLRSKQRPHPAAEGASRESLAGRLAAYPELFWLLEEEGEVRAFVNGFATDTPDLTDEMYDRPGLYDPAGAWQMIFSVVTAPEWRGQGCASALLTQMLADAGPRAERAWC